MPKLIINVKEDIIKISREMLKKEGYDQVCIRSIASNCGIAPGTIYNYYKSKDEIITEIVLDDWEIIIRRMDQIIRNDIPPIERLEKIFCLLKEFVIDFHGVWLEMFMKINTDRAQSIEKSNIKCLRNDYRAQLKDRIYFVLSDSISEGLSDESILFLSEILARSFLSFCTEKDFDFSSFIKFLTDTYPSLK